MSQWLQRHARVPVRLVTFENVDRSELLTRLSDAEVRAMAHLVTPEGIEYHGGEAVTRSLRLVRFGGVAAVLDLPVVRHLRNAGYALVARARPLLSRWLHP
jgi:predicted DCC family thiol-disulfide oxidoreductase YuxK